MKRTAMRVAFATCLAAAAPSAAAAQQVEASFGTLQEKLGDAAAAKPAQEQILSRISQDAFALQVAAPKIAAADAPDFARSMSYNATLLGLASKSSDSEAAAIFADVADDLEVKRAAASGMAASSTFPGRVKVRIATLRNGSAVTGYTITLSPVRWQSAEPMFRLPSLSPSGGEVPPGRYEVAAVLNDQVKVKQIHRIGLAAEDLVNIQLPVP
jgi:hypothetical protein